MRKWVRGVNRMLKCDFRRGVATFPRAMLSDLTLHRDAIAELCRRFEVERLEVFGSAAGEDFDPQRSDVDFLVSFLPGATDLDNYLALADGLEALLGRRVDVVIERAIRNRYFRAAVEASRRPIYARTEQEAAV